MDCLLNRGGRGLSQFSFGVHARFLVAIRWFYVALSDGKARVFSLGDAARLLVHGQSPSRGFDALGEDM